MPNERPSRIAIGLGSNEGDRLAHLRFGLERIRWLLDEVVASPVFETSPVGWANQPLFLNACCAGRTRLAPRRILAHLQEAELDAGRTREGLRFGPRPLDLDILLWGTEVLAEPGLAVPHPRLRERAFVLIPLAEIAPEWIVPARMPEEADATVGDLAARIHSEGAWRTTHAL